MQDFSSSPKEMGTSLWRNRNLIRSLVRRDVVGRYRGSFLGILWSFFNPIFMLLVYTFVFSIVFKARWNSGSDSKAEFALVLFAGLLVFNLFSECFNRAPSLILSNVNYVKKVVFPLEILPWVTLGSALFHAAASLVIWLCAHFILIGTPPITILWLPIVLIPLLFFIMGIAWALSALSVYFRDIVQLTGMATTVILFLSPIFYPVSALPERYRVLLNLNPISTVIETVRDVMYWGKAPNVNTFFVHLVLASVTLCLGFICFQKTRKGFSDVL
jgi:lipopolysaccharide transport system permease protein